MLADSLRGAEGTGTSLRVRQHVIGLGEAEQHNKLLCAKNNDPVPITSTVKPVWRDRISGRSLVTGKINMICKVCAIEIGQILRF